MAWTASDSSHLELIVVAYVHNRRPNVAIRSRNDLTVKLIGQHRVQPRVRTTSPDYVSGVMINDCHSAALPCIPVYCETAARNILLVHIIHETTDNDKL